nr:PepSY-associated TM helix domain-containing protein [Methylosinus sp. Sm6]
MRCSPRRRRRKAKRHFCRSDAFARRWRPPFRRTPRSAASTRRATRPAATRFYYEAPDGDTRRLCIDPYTAKILGDRVYWSKSGVTRHSFMSFLFQLHWSLLLYDLAGDPGVVVAIAALLLMASVATGVYLWWPSPGKWLGAVTLKRHASGERLNYDLHKLGGIYTALVLLAVLISGVSMNLTTQFQWVVELFSPLGAAQRGELVSGAPAGRSRMPFELAVSSATRRYPEGRLAHIDFPKDATGAYQLCREDIEEISRFIGQRCVFVDQYSGDILGVRDPVHATAGEVFMQWQWPLHSGRAFG